MDLQQTKDRLHDHLVMLTRSIGERSVRYPKNLSRTADFIYSFFESIQVPVRLEPYPYRDMSVSNVVAELSCPVAVCDRSNAWRCLSDQRRETPHP